MQAIPVPLRKRIIELYEQGRSTQEIAQFSGFCVAAVRRVRQQFRAAIPHSCFPSRFNPLKLQLLCPVRADRADSHSFFA
jgi:hypothetical protein